LKIGELDLGNKLILAPMADISDKSFRKIAKDFGAGLTFTQMVSAEGVVTNNFETLRFLSFSRQEKPIGVQILGNDPDIIGEAVAEIEKFNPDVIDLNSGCSVSKVTRHSFGASLLESPDLLAQIIRRMKLSSRKTPISVKFRLGKDKHNVNILDNARIAEENGADYVVIHCRTRIDKYEADANWEWIEKTKNILSIPVVANGSLFEPSDIIEVREKFHADGAMIARGAIGNPFLFSRYNSVVENNFDPGEPDIDSVLQTVLTHIQYIREDYGDDIGIQKIKKHIVWYFKNFVGIESILEKVFGFSEFSELIEFLEEHVFKIKNNKYKLLNNIDVQRLFNEKINFWELSV
jgi:tRNA-dihydrouridine synthase B